MLETLYCMNVTVPSALGGELRRHCHSTSDMLSTASAAVGSGGSDGVPPHLRQSVNDMPPPPPVRLRHNRPKSEGSFCADKMRVKRASSFGVRQLVFT